MLAYLLGTLPCYTFYITPPYLVVDCLWSGYSVWSQCSSSCGEATRTRTRRILQQALKGGADCEGENLQTEDCDLPPCPSTLSSSSSPSPSSSSTTTSPSTSPSSPCRPTQPPAWGPCSTTCGGGLRRRQKTVEVVSTDGTTQCSEEIEEEECLIKTCPGSGKDKRSVLSVSA